MKKIPSLCCSLIDLHSNTGYSNGPMNQYADYMAFVDRLWFGESFRHNQMSADRWLITFSGIPFGAARHSGSHTKFADYLI